MAGRRRARRDLTPGELVARGPIDLPYLMLLLLLLGIGVLMVMSASYATGGDTPLAMALDQAKYVNTFTPTFMREVGAYGFSVCIFSFWR